MSESITIRRFDPSVDREPYDQTYSCRILEGMSVLNVLDQIRQEQDPTLAYAACCKAGLCGVCGAVVNGAAALLCRCPAADGMYLEPLKGFPVKRDLLVDRSGYEGRRDGMRLFLERRDAPRSQPEPVAPGAFDAFKVPSRCIECYCCVSACPACQRDPVFAGPCAFVLLARHMADPRDQLNRDLIARDMGMDACVLCGRCSQVCPVGARPAETMALLKGKAT